MESKEVYLIINDGVIDNNDAFDVIEPLWWSVSIYDGEEQYLRDQIKFSQPQKFVFAIQWYISEVNNGGHDQFYFNSTGIVWEDALKGFWEVGLLENYSILKESAERLGGYPSKDRDKRQDQLDKYAPSFDDLDNQLYDIESKIEPALLNYIRNNKRDFYFEGMVTMFD